MNKEKELYTSPEVEVMEGNARQIICQSGEIEDGGINDMVREPDQELDW